MQQIMTIGQGGSYKMPSDRPKDLPLLDQSLMET